MPRLNKLPINYHATPSRRSDASQSSEKIGPLVNTLKHAAKVFAGKNLVFECRFSALLSSSLLVHLSIASL